MKISTSLLQRTTEELKREGVPGCFIVMTAMGVSI